MSEVSAEIDRQAQTATEKERKREKTAWNFPASQPKKVTDKIVVTADAELLFCLLERRSVVGILS